MTDPATELRTALAGRYELAAEVGRGGMATVYRARDLKHDRDVAVKVLHREVAASIGKDRFLREIQITARLQHPHILPLHDSGAAGDLLYYIMPFVEGESLRQRLLREGALELEEALRIARELGDALGYAHSLGVVHRDVKPENVLLASGHAFMVDFGVARPIDVSAAQHITEAGLSIGTPAYMSPEQARGEKLDGRSDLYSLGCVVYEMLTGRPPFAAPTLTAVIAALLTEEPAPLRAQRESVSAAVDAAVRKVLSKVPADRYATAAQFVAALEGAVQEEAPPADQTSVVVLDFRNISGDPALDWLAGGIAETVTVDLTKLAAGPRIIGRDRAVRAQRMLGATGVTEEGVREIGRALGARWVVWGGFQAMGTTVRITPQFRDTTTGEVISAAKIDGAMEDIFRLQDEIVKQLMAVLEVEISRSGIQRITKPETVALKAYEYYAKGRQQLRQLEPAALEKAQALFQQAIDADPEYAQAYSGLGSAFVMRYIATTRRDDLDLGITHLQRALELDSDLAEPYRMLTFAYGRTRRFEEAERVGCRATELEPDHGLGHYFLATAYHARASVDYRRELVVNAINHYARAIHLQPNFAPACMCLAWLFIENGQYPFARGLLDHCVWLEESGKFKEFRSVGGITSRGWLHLREGQPDRAADVFDRALAVMDKVGHVYNDTYRAWTYCGKGELAYRRGEYDNAVAEFARACEVASAHPEKMAIGHFLIRARLGLARALRQLGMRREEEREWRQAAALLAEGTGFDFSWSADTGEAVTQYALASYHAAAGRRAEAVAAIERAVAAGWSDVGMLAGDEDLAALRAFPGAEAAFKALDEREPLPEEPAGGITGVLAASRA
jgi:serine/threonine-protein kinase